MMNFQKLKHSFRRTPAALLLPAALLVALAACSDDATDPTEALQGPSGLVLIPVSSPTDITPDGSTALLEERFDAAKLANLYFYDVASGTLNYQTNAGTFQSFATGVSANRRISANYSEPTIAAIWSQGSNWVTMPAYFPSGCEPIYLGGAWDISADGHTWVGSDWNGCATQAMRWSDAGGTIATTALELLGSNFPGSASPPSNRASAISDDGLWAGGWAQTELADRRPALWGPDGLGTFLTSGLTEDCPGEVLSLSTDGSIAGGVWCQQGFYWTAATGTVILEGMVYVNAIAANGNLLFGAGNEGATVWTPAAGTRSLQDVATAAGVEIPNGFVMTGAFAASTDGTFVLGQGFTKTNVAYSFLLKLPASAYGL
jgi:hypothetical protein